MATKKQIEAIRLYAGIMEEAKMRLNSIDMALGGVTILPNPLVREFCFLQLRMLCELIALGALTAHGDIEATTKLKNEWSAGSIVDRLGDLHPDFYPWPIRQQKMASGHWAVEPVINSDSLAKQELITLSGRSGDVLHRGSLKKLLSEKTPIQHNFPDITRWSRKISLLLNHHAIVLLGGEVILCMLRDASNNNQVQVVIAERSHGPPIPPSGQPHPSS